MKLHHFLLSILALTLLGGSSSYALRATKVASHFCPLGSEVDRSWIVLIYEDGRLASGYGVCCDGTPWSKSFGLSDSSLPGGTDLNASITWSSAGHLAVTADAVIDLRIINLRTGQEIGEVYRYTRVGVTAIYDVSTLPPGLYGIGIYYDGSAVDLKPFSTIN